MNELATALKCCMDSLAKLVFQPDRDQQRMALRSNAGQIILEMSEHLSPDEYKFALQYCHVDPQRAMEYKSIYLANIRKQMRYSSET